MRFPALLIIGVSMAGATSTWTCWTANTIGPQLAPPNVATACSAATASGWGAMWTQNATYQIQPTNLQTRGVGATVTVTVSADGVCTSKMSPYSSLVPTFGPATALDLGSNLQWSVLTQGYDPSYFTVPGFGKVYWNGQRQAVMTKGLTNIAAPPCQCYPSDCANGIAKQQCGSTCTVSNCAPPYTACGATCYQQGGVCGQNGSCSAARLAAAVRRAV